MAAVGKIPVYSADIGDSTRNVKKARSSEDWQFAQHVASEASGDPASGPFPVVQNCDFPSISPSCLKGLLAGKESHHDLSIHIFDCRFPYEFMGGHIEGAQRIDSPQALETFYIDHEEEGQEMAIIFHCEFSSVRAPKLYRHMRQLDRMKHLPTYPELAFPHMYILDGGYKAFFEQSPGQCEPQEYVKMVDPRFEEQAKSSHMRLKRSWSLNSRDHREAESTRRNAERRLVAAGKEANCRQSTRRGLEGSLVGTKRMLALQ